MSSKKGKIFLAAVAVCISGMTASAAGQTAVQETVAQETSAQETTAQETAAARMQTAQEKSVYQDGKQRRSDITSVDEVTEIEILKMPARTKFYGNYLNSSTVIELDGIELRLTYEDGESVDVACHGNWYSEENDWYYEWGDIYAEYDGRYVDQGEMGDCCATGRQTVTVYCGSASAEYQVQVLGLKRVTLEKEPECRQYWCGDYEIGSHGGIPEETDLSGMELRAVFSDGSSGKIVCKEEVGGLAWFVNGTDRMEDALTEATMKDGELSVALDGCACAMQTDRKRVKAISIKSLPYETEVYEDMFYSMPSIEGIVLNVVFMDGTTDTLSYLDPAENNWHRWADSKGNYVSANVYYDMIGYGSDGRKYGTWQVKIELDEGTAEYQFRIMDYIRKDCGALTLDRKNEIWGEEHHVYTYTFTPQETGMYAMEFQKTENVSVFAEISNEIGMQFCYDWLLKAGKQYKVEVFVPEVYEANCKIEYTMKKKAAVKEQQLTEARPEQVVISENMPTDICYFAPKTSGVYRIYAELTSGDNEIYGMLCDPELENIWASGYGDSEGMEDVEFTVYLTAGERYAYLLWSENARDLSMSVYAEQQEDTCGHAWEEIADETCDSTCARAGKREEHCQYCGVAKYSMIPRKAHQFGAQKITKEATALTEGVKERVCSLCGQRETVKIPKLASVLKMNVSSIPLKVKQTTTAVKVTEMAKGDAVASWTSSNPKIVKVTNAGKITAGKKTGKAVLTVKLKSGKTAKVTVKVQKKKVATKKIKVGAKKITLKKGQSYTLAPVVTPITTQDKVTYSASKKKVASVSKKGVIKAKKPGTSKIRIKSGKKKVVVTVKVTK